MSDSAEAGGAGTAQAAQKGPFEAPLSSPETPRHTPPSSPPPSGPSPAVDQPRIDPRIAELSAELERARARVDELSRAYQASERDREAFKQRLVRERDQLLDVEKGKVVGSLLEAIDELDLCLKSVDDSPLAKGVRLIRDGLVKRATMSGVERVDLEGKPFDPNLAEAMDLEMVFDPARDGLVLAVERACYRLGGRVIRAGRVKVARYARPAEA
jgi:molecular chaperone GrpE